MKTGRRLDASKIVQDNLSKSEMGKIVQLQNPQQLTRQKGLVCSSNSYRKNNLLFTWIFGMAQNSSSPDKYKTRFSWYRVLKLHRMFIFTKKGDINPQQNLETPPGPLGLRF